ncbi:MAG: hypothetical protein ACR2PF_17880 [Rhizobiaceae bacterium]
MRTVFIHTNEKQMVGAHVSAYSMKRQASDPDSFDVQIIRKEDYSWFDDYEGRQYLREGGPHVWENDDLQSFTPLRFMPPELMGYKGRAVVVDPDVFAIGDICKLLDRDMEGKAVLAKPRPGHKGYSDYIATSVMLMDCEKLKHWHCQTMFNELFEWQRDYELWMRLGDEPKESIGHLESIWNDFDRLEKDTQLLHNTKRRTQPWKSGLPIDFTNRLGLFGLLPAKWTPTKWITRVRLPGSYKQHPDNRQTNVFFAYLRECLDTGILDEQLVRKHMSSNHVRHDALDVVRTVPKVDEILAF